MNALNELLEFCDTDTLVTRYYAIGALGQVDATNYDEVEFLGNCLADQDHGTRRAAILALKDKGMEAQRLIPELIHCLNDPKAIDVSVFAAQILGNLGEKASLALPDLYAALKHPDNSAFTSEFETAIQKIQDAKKESAAVPD